MFLFKFVRHCQKTRGWREGRPGGAPRHWAGARPVPGKKAFVFISLARGKKSARARPAPPKHAPRSDADSAGCVPNSLSFATSHRLPKVTRAVAGVFIKFVRVAVHVWRERAFAAATADRLGESSEFRALLVFVDLLSSRLSHPVSHRRSPRRSGWLPRRWNS